MTDPKREIEKAFRNLAAAVHPDRNPDPEAVEQFRQVIEARNAIVTAPSSEIRVRKPGRKRAPRGMGTIILRGSIYWIAFSHAGRRYVESVKSTEKKDATDLLKNCWSAIRSGEFVSISAVRDHVRPTSGATLADLRDAVFERARRKGLRSFKRREQLLTNLIRHLGADAPLEFIDKAALDRYVAARLKDPVGELDKDGKAKKFVGPATINRELSLLLQGFRILERPVPKVTMLAEPDPRDRWPAVGEVEKVIGALPAHLQPAFHLLRITGWRVNEALRLEWHRVDREAGTIRLGARDNKTKKPRSYPFGAHPELAQIIEERWAATVKWQRTHGQLCPFVFWKEGVDAKGNPVASPITIYSKPWRSACKKAGVVGLIPHDLRRGAARLLIRSGVDEAVAMRLLGHKTDSIFRRYNVTSDDDTRDAVKKLAQAAAQRVGDEEQRQA